MVLDSEQFEATEEQEHSEQLDLLQADLQGEEVGSWLPELKEHFRSEYFPVLSEHQKGFSELFLKDYLHFLRQKPEDYFYIWRQLPEIR